MPGEQDQPPGEQEPNEPAGDVVPEMAPEKSAERRKRVKLPFGLPESPYETLKRILKAMNRQGGAGTRMTLGQVVQTAGLTTRTVSANNKFLLSTGLVLKSGNNFYLTERGAQLALALEYEDVEDISRAWRSVAIEIDFFRSMLDALDLSHGMSEADFVSRIMRAAGAPTKEEPYLTGGKAIVEIMLDSGLVSKDEETGKLAVTSDYRDLRTAGGTGGPIEEKEALLPGLVSTGGTLANPNQGIVLNVNVTISPTTTSEEIDAIANRIKELREKLK